MFDPKDELLRFLEDNGVEPWVRDDFARWVRVDDWADQFIGEAAEVLTEDGNDAAGLLGELRDYLNEKNRRSVTVKKLREILQLKG